MRKVQELTQSLSIELRTLDCVVVHRFDAIKTIQQGSTLGGLQTLRNDREHKTEERRVSLFAAHVQNQAKVPLNQVMNEFINLLLKSVV